MSAALTFSVLADFDDGHMNLNSGWGVLIIVLMVAMMGGMGWMMFSMMRGRGGGAPHTPEDPVEVLKARYARGELTTEEFHERLRTMEDLRG